MRRLEDAVTKVGLFAVTDYQTQNGDEESSGALVHFGRCVAESGHDLAQTGDALHSQLKDGTRKITVAAATNGTKTYPLPARVQESCPDFSRESIVSAPSLCLSS